MYVIDLLNFDVEYEQQMEYITCITYYPMQWAVVHHLLAP